MTQQTSPFDGGTRAVLFDLDGTLIDTAPDMVRVLAEMLADHAVEPVPYETARNNVSNGAIGLLRLGFPDIDQERMTALHGEYLERYEGQVCEDSALFPHLDELLTRLEDADCPWGIVTNKPMRMTDALLLGLDLTRRAACAISGDTLPVRKPDPAPLLHASDLVGVEAAHCLYVGDAARDIEAGRNAGMGTVAVGYGYITDDDDPTRWDADRFAASTEELAKLVAKAVNLDT